MQPVQFDDAETYEPEEGWRRVAMAGSEQFSFEWFEKPPGHSSPMHDHENEQVCLCLAGELTVETEDVAAGEGEGEGGSFIKAHFESNGHVGAADLYTTWGDREGHLYDFRSQDAVEAAGGANAISEEFNELREFFFAGSDLTFSIERMVTVMVIACPHALGLAIPLVVAINTSLAARNGMLVRDRIAMEEARNLDNSATIGLVDNRTLPIRFRLDEGALEEELAVNTAPSASGDPAGAA